MSWNGPNTVMSRVSTTSTAVTNDYGCLMLANKANLANHFILIISSLSYRICSIYNICITTAFLDLTTTSSNGKCPAPPNEKLLSFVGFFFGCWCAMLRWLSTANPDFCLYARFTAKNFDGHSQCMSTLAVHDILFVLEVTILIMRSK